MRTVRIVLLLLVSTLLLWLLVATARRSADLTPGGDSAVIESYTLRAIEGNLRVGPYSRFQWHHPGPLYFYVLAPFYALTGNRTAGLSAGTVAINFAALAVIMYTVVRLADPSMALAVAFASTLYVFRARELLTSVWNPHVLVVPTMALAVASAGVMSGALWLLPVVALFASFVAQTHVAVVPVTVVFTAASLAGVARSAVKGHAVPRLPVVATLLVLTVVWFPVMVEQVQGRPGNLAELWSFFAGRAVDAQPFRTAVQAWADMTSGVLRPDFAVAHGDVFRRSRVSWAQTATIAELLVLAGFAFWSATTKQRFNRAFASILLAASLVSLWSATRIEGDLTDHEVFWMSGLGALTLSVLIGLGFSLLQQFNRMPRVLRSASTGSWTLFAVCVVVGFVQLRQAATRSNVPPTDAAAIRDVTVAIQDYVRLEGNTRPLIVIDQATWHWAAGVLLQLQKSGTPFVVERDWLPMFTDDVAPTGGESVAITIGGADRHFRNRSRPGNLVIAERPPIFADAERLR